MERAQILSAVEAETRDLADFAESFTDQEWTTPSLCPAWTVVEVVAHLTLSTRQSLAETLLRAVKARGSFDLMNARWAQERAATFSPAELVAQLRETASSPRRLVVSKPMDPLVDFLVHGQDIARPLGRERVMPVERVVPALDFIWDSPFYQTAKRLDGVRFSAVDAQWSRGRGPREIRGPAGELLLLAAGRTVALDALTGSGVRHARALLQA